MIYAVIQFLCIGILALNVNIEDISYIQIALLITASILGAVSVYVMKISNLNILPDLKDKIELRTNSIYATIRHPMYSSVLIFCLALVLNTTTFFTLIIYILLYINLTLKARYEERKLLDKFDEYKDYKQTTFMFFPIKFL